MSYVELQCASHFSFLRGASSCEELFAQAAACGLDALAVTDRNSLAGIVRAHEAARATGVRLIVGCRLVLEDGAEILVYPRDRAGYARLCRLLTVGKRRAGKGGCRLGWDDLETWGEGWIAVLVPDGLTAARRNLVHLVEVFGDDAHLALTLHRRPRDQMRLHQLCEAARAAAVRTVVTNDVLFHHPDRRILQDVVTCIREGCTIDDVGFRRSRTADRHLKPVGEMHRLFARYPEALARTVEIADLCRFSLDELAYQYPREAAAGQTPQEALEALTWAGAADRYPEGLPDKVRAALKHELGLIETLGYAPYFLTVHSIVRFARSRDILCQGRGSAANSAVCFVLGVTSIDPGRNDLLFERFVSQERKEPPDIDVDFEHERREEVIQWIYDTYGRDRDCTLEPTEREDRFAVRLGLRMVRGLANGDAARLVTNRGDRPFAGIDDLWRRAMTPVGALTRLAEADAFLEGLRLSRRDALWSIKALRDDPLPLFAAASAEAGELVPEVDEPDAALPAMPAGQEVVEDYTHVGVTLRDHPLAFLRDELQVRHVMTCADGTAMRDRRLTRVAGLVLVRQKPGSAKGVMFITIEDETGVANLVIWPSLYEQQRRVVLGASLLVVDGRVQREGEVVHIVAERLHDGSDLLASLGRRGEFRLPHGRGDEVYRGDVPPS